MYYIATILSMFNLKEPAIHGELNPNCVTFNASSAYNHHSTCNKKPNA